MGNLLLIFGCAGFALYVIVKIIQSGIEHSDNDDKEQKEYLDNHSDDLPAPKDYEK